MDSSFWGQHPNCKTQLFLVFSSHLSLTSGVLREKVLAHCAWSCAQCWKACLHIWMREWTLMEHVGSVQPLTGELSLTLIFFMTQHGSRLGKETHTHTQIPPHTDTHTFSRLFAETSPQTLETLDPAGLGKNFNVRQCFQSQLCHFQNVQLQIVPLWNYHSYM